MIQKKNAALILRFYGILLIVIGAIALIISLIIMIPSINLSIKLASTSSGDPHSRGIAGFIYMMSIVSAALVMLFSIYYLNCGIKITISKYTRRRRIVHTSILLVLSILQTQLGLIMISSNFWPEVPYISILFFVASLATAIMSTICIVFCQRN